MVAAQPAPVQAAPTPGSSIPPEELEQLTADIVAALKTVYDPEIPADIYELGLIYKIDVDDARNVAIEMTLTAPGCPVAGEMPVWVENAVASVAGVGQVVKLTFDPPWDKDRMSDEAKLALDMFSTAPCLSRAAGAEGVRPLATAVVAIHRRWRRRSDPRPRQRIALVIALKVVLIASPAFLAAEMRGTEISAASRRWPRCLSRLARTWRSGRSCHGAPGDCRRSRSPAPNVPSLAA